jgi:hypothetical protein
MEVTVAKPATAGSRAMSWLSGRVARGNLTPGLPQNGTVAVGTALFEPVPGSANELSYLVFIVCDTTARHTSAPAHITMTTNLCR